jgi:hypothetical protein
MGRGNYCPPRDICDAGYEMVYIPIEHFDDDKDMEYYYEGFYNSLKEYIIDLLPKCFKWLSYETRYNSEGVQLGLSNSYEVYLADNEWSYALVIYNIPSIDDRILGFANINLKRTAKKLFDKLNESYDLYVRCGPWTSGKYNA